MFSLPPPPISFAPMNELIDGKKIRLLSVINRLNLGGPTYNVAYLTRYLPDYYESLLVSGLPEAGEESSEYILESLDVRASYLQDMRRALNPFSDSRSYFQMKELIRQFQPSIVHTHAAKAGAIGRPAAWAENVPVVIHTFHGHVFNNYFSPLKTRLFIEIERYLARRSDCVIAISELQKRDLVEKYKICPTEKVSVVPNGFDLTRFTENQAALRADFRQRYHVSDETFAIGIIGRLAPIKNHTLFLEAIKAFGARSETPFKAFIIGDGETRAATERTARALGIPFTASPPFDAPLIFTSWIKNIEWATAGLDVVALSSLNEGTPVSLVEAQAAARPVVATDVGGVADVVLAGESGLLVPSNDVRAFADALHALALAPELRARMGANGRAFAIKYFSYQTLIQNMDALYQTLLKKKGVL